MIIEVSSSDPNILGVASTHKILVSLPQVCKSAFSLLETYEQWHWKTYLWDIIYIAALILERKNNNIKYFEARIPKGHNGTVNKMHLHFLYVFTGLSFRMMHGQITSQINHANSVVFSLFWPLVKSNLSISAAKHWHKGVVQE